MGARAGGGEDVDVGDRAKSPAADAARGRAGQGGGRATSKSLSKVK